MFVELLQNFKFHIDLAQLKTRLILTPTILLLLSNRYTWLMAIKYLHVFCGTYVYTFIFIFRLLLCITFKISITFAVKFESLILYRVTCAFLFSIYTQFGSQTHSRVFRYLQYCTIEYRYLLLHKIINQLCR